MGQKTILGHCPMFIDPNFFTKHQKGTLPVLWRKIFLPSQKSQTDAFSDDFAETTTRKSPYPFTPQTCQFLYNKPLINKLDCKWRARYFQFSLQPGRALGYESTLHN